MVVAFALKFLIELVGWAGCGFLGFRLAPDTPLGWVLAFAVPIAVVVLWALFVAPRAPRRLPTAPRIAVEMLVFGAGALGFALAGWPAFAIGFVVVFVLTEVFLVLSRAEEHRFLAPPER